jgi:hypothetical protein
MPTPTESLCIDMQTPMRDVLTFVRRVGAGAGLSSSKATLAATVVSDLFRSVRWWCTDGEGVVEIAEEPGTISVQLKWQADVPEAPNWLACSDIRLPALRTVLDGFDTWHDASSEAYVFFRVHA